MYLYIPFKLEIFHICIMVKNILEARLAVFAQFTPDKFHTLHMFVFIMNKQALRLQIPVYCQHKITSAALA